MYTVYVLYSEKFNKIYVGATSDLEQRFLSHNELSKKGWTVKFRPWKIVHTEEYEVKSEALVREKQLKSSRGRDYIRKQILGQK
ncbi:MAG: GIY-YIG nuclease family protein [Cyclobacteriaceae bacterium]